MTLTATLDYTGTLSREGVPVSYERISKFRVNRNGVDVMVTRGVTRQGQDNDAAAEAMGLGIIPTAQHYTDEDRSASQYATKPRERWLDLLRDIRSGSVSHVLVWLFDRAARTTEDTEALLAACREGGTLIVQTAGNITVADPNNPDDIFRLKLAGLLAEYEVAKMATRQRRAKAAAAKQGVPHGGRRRFGYEPGMREIRESEAEIIRDIASRLLSGESLNSCAKWLTEHGIESPSGGKWQGGNLRTMMLRPHLAGLRVHHGEIIGEASWEPILTVATRDALLHLLGDPARRTSFSNARKYLLAGLGRCETCGLPLRGRTRDGKKDPTPVYVCESSRHVHRVASEVDELVEERIIARLEQTDASGALTDSTSEDLVASLTMRLAELRAQRTARGVELAAAGLDAESMADIMNGYTETIATVTEDLEQARAAARRPQIALDGMTGSEAAQAWRQASLGRKRAVMDLLCESITLRGTQRNRAHRDLTADDIEIRWAIL